MLGFSGEKRETSEVSASSRSTAEAKRASAVRRRALLRPRIRPGPTEAFRRGSLDILDREVIRSRRFGHSFFLAVVPCPLPHAEADGWHNRAAALLTSLVRNVDSVWVDGTDVYLLLPESDRVNGTAALARIREPLSRGLPEVAREGIHSTVFAPDECPTSRALLADLKRRVRDQKARTRGFTEQAGIPLSEREGTGG